MNRCLLFCSFVLFVAGVHAQPRIVGGVDAKENEARFQVLLMDSVTGDSCGGSAVALRKVITAAHCVENFPRNLYFVRYGTNYRFFSKTRDIVVSEVAVHPEWKSKNVSSIPQMRGDIAVLTLERPFKVKRVKLIEPEWKPLPEEPTNLTIFGFGVMRPFNPGDVYFTARKLQKTTVPTVVKKKCTEYIGDESLNGPLICTENPGKSNACFGDSGGPVVNADGRLVGVVSKVESGCHPGAINLHTRISHYADWIREKLGPKGSSQ